MHLVIKNQVLASRKNVISSAISTLLTYTGIFRLNGHDLVYFIVCFDFYLHCFSESRSSSGSLRPSVRRSVRPQHFRDFQVCVICNSKSFHSFSFKLCLMIVHILKMCTFYFVHVSFFFSFLRGVELSHFFHPKCLGGA